MITIVKGTKETDWLELYNKGMNDTEIGTLLSLSTETIRQRRIKLNLPSNFSYVNFKTIDENKVLELVNEGKSDLEIAKILNVSKDGIYAVRKRCNFQKLPQNISKNIPITQIQKEFIIGCVLGDGSLIKDKGCINPRFTCEHSIKQKEYAYYKYNILNGLSPHIRYNKRITPDKRNNNIYESYTVRLNTSPSLLWCYNQFYKSGTKQITKSILNYYTPFAIAIHYMDDGYKDSYGYKLATQSFNNKSLELLRIKLLEYNIKTTIQNNNIIYIRSESSNIFTNLVEPYFIESMKYKLHRSVS